MIYKFQASVLWTTAISTIILYVTVYIGDLFPLELPERFLGLHPGPQWILILFAYALIASLLPVWSMLQPRGAINGIQLFVGLALVYGAVFIANPTVIAPAINSAPAGAPPIVPLLFVTIACGAISGFHGLVSSGTTSKQLNKETDARFVGYFGSVGEGALALATIIATAAGFASLSEWELTYAKFGDGGIAAFAQGGARILGDGLGIPLDFGLTLLTVMAVLFASTTMDAGVRLQRYIVQEWGNIYSIPLLKNGYVATFVAVAACLALAFGAGGVEGKGGMFIWPLFGTTNQLLAGLTLLLISVILVKRGRPSKFTMIPMVFVTTMSFFSALYQLWDLYTNENYLLVALDIMIIIAAVFVMLESFSTFLREKKANALARHLRHSRSGRGAGVSTRVVKQSSMDWSKIRDKLAQAKYLFTEFYHAPYRGTIARVKRDEDDLFMLFVFSEMMGIPNPVTFYTLELQPILLEKFHDWHKRMGMERSPIDDFKCC